MASATVTLRENNVADTGAETLLLRTQNGDTICADITDNIFDGQNVNIDAQQAGTTINVERLTAGTGGPLDLVNTFTNLSVEENGAGTITPRDAGYCGTL